MENDYRSQYFDLEDTHWWFRVRRSLIDDLLDRFLSGTATSSTQILDFGCSAGGLVYHLQQRGFKAQGADISQEAIDLGRQKYGLNLVAMKGNHLDFADNTFDCVVTLDVLEHLEDERWAIAEIGRVLKKDGICIIFVPAFQFLWSTQDEVNQHYRRYSMRTLRSAVDGARTFTVLKKSYFNFFLFPFVALVKLIARWSKTKNYKSDFELNNTFLNSIFFLIFNFERKLLRYMNFPFGVSALLVLKKI